MMRGVFQRQNAGFTLVELAIVMIIIGLLLTGVLKGQEMIRNAQIKSTASQFKAFHAAHYTFLDIYNALPGDMTAAIATARIPGCTAANFCGGGNRDGQIGDQIDNMTDLSTTANIQENIQYWKHLALADLISGVNASADSNPANSQWNGSHPAAAVGGGWNIIRTDPAGIGDYGGIGPILQLTEFPNTNSVYLEPLTAAIIDRILDDGLPNTGAVTAEYSSSSNCDEDATNTYLESGTTGECMVYFQLQ